MEQFEQFYNDLKYTEKRDSNLTSEQQIDRILRPGSSYLNLNPFEVILKFKNAFRLAIVLCIIQKIYTNFSERNQPENLVFLF